MADVVKIASYICMRYQQQYSKEIDEMKLTATEIKGAITGKNIEVAVDENGIASGIIDVDSPEFGEATGAITINGLNADIATAL